MVQTRVLVADDNEGFGTLLGRFVASHSDMDVVGLARNGREAVAMAAVLRPDIVLMDLYMPELDGFEATRMVSGVDPDVAIVAMTAHWSPDIERRSYDAGARAFVPKPEAAARLIGVIRGLAGSGGPQGTASGGRPVPN